MKQIILFSSSTILILAVKRAGKVSENLHELFKKGFDFMFGSGMDSK